LAQESISVGIAALRAASSKNFRGEGRITFSNDYDVIDVQPTMLCGLFASSAVLPQAFLQKSLDLQKNSLDLKNITTFKIFALK